MSRKNRSAMAGWMNLSFDAMRLSAEAQTVIALRMMKLAAGGAAADAEARRMVAEKVGAAAELQTKIIVAAMTGAAVTPAAAMNHYRRKVSANRRRLSKPG